LAKLGDEMLPDYDAEAVARLMGLRFRGSKKAQPKLASSATASRLLGAKEAVNKLARSPRGFVVVVRASPVLIEKAVEAGLPRQALRHVAESLAGGDKSKIAFLELGVVPKTTLERRAGTKLSLEESERTERLARLFVHATRALGSEDEAREFMTAPHAELNGRSPFEAAKTDLGGRRVEDILRALEYGLAR
jgi:putative toxin-antitoxin system antitoxin component (TIGR02293 family)